MIFNIVFYFLKHNNSNIGKINYLEIYIGFIIYALLLNVKLLRDYSVLIIPIDLYILNKMTLLKKDSVVISKIKKHDLINNEIKSINKKLKKKNIIKNITEIIYNYFYHKKDKYIQKKLDIKDTLIHTLDNLKIN